MKLAPLGGILLLALLLIRAGRKSGKTDLNGPGNDTGISVNEAE